MSIIATSQQSRRVFHAATLDSTNEVDLKGVSISVGGGKLDVLVDAHVRFKQGQRYALLGRNGSGKSTLFRALRDGLIPGFPPSIRVLLVSQTEDDSSLDLTPESSSLSVLDKVIASDRARTRSLREFDDLSSAIESGSLSQVEKAVASIKLAELKDEVDDKRRIAVRRSGTRGKAARLEEEKWEAKLSEAEQAMETLNLGGSIAKDPLQEGTVLLQELQMWLELLDYKTTTSRASTILVGLGFSQAMIEGPFASLSGGWRSRCALAGGLLVGSELLLLDEPSNFLDLPATIWLENYLTTMSDSSIERTIVITSHDQDFLDSVTDETCIFQDKALVYFEGTPSQMELETRKKNKKLRRMAGAMDKKKAHIEKSIQQGRASAKQTGDDNRMRMAKSREKKLEDRWGLEVNAKGHRFKLNRDLAGYHTTTRAELEDVKTDPPVTMIIPDPAPLRTVGDLVTFDKVSFAYPIKGSKTKLAPPLLKDVSFTVEQGGRVAFVGKNGEGKSTIANLLLGTTIKPTSGRIDRHSLLRVAHFSQHSVEELMADARRSAKKITALEYFLERFRSQGLVVENEEARRCMGGLGLGGKVQLAAVENLSGGQAVRLAFSLVVFRPAPLLLLDEITTHLDLPTIKALAVALRSYSGAVVLISHDRWFTRVVVEGASLRQIDGSGSESDESDSDDDEDDSKPRGKVYRVGGGKIRQMEGGIDEYVAKVEKQAAKDQKRAMAAAKVSSM